MASTSTIPTEAPFGHETLRRRRTLGSTVPDSEKVGSDSNSNEVPGLERIDHDEATQLGLPPLTFRPAILENFALYLTFVFNFSVLGILVYLYVKQEFNISDVWAYFVIKLLPTIVGTITKTIADATVAALNRIQPFMMCADAQAQYKGAPASTTLLSSYFPSPSIRDIVMSRSWVLMFASVMSYTSIFMVSLKATFLLTKDYEQARIVPWAVLVLIAFYGLFCVFLGIIFFSFRGRITGLRWDPVSIADQLVLFRHSDFLERFLGTCIASRTSLNRALGEHTRLRLGYWKKGATYWHGFGIVDNNHQTGQDQSQTPPVGAEDNETSVKLHEISYRRYSSASTTVHPLSIWLFTIFILVLLIGSLVLVIIGSSQEYKFNLPFSSNVAAVLLAFILTFFVGLGTDFIEALGYFIAKTEPFIHFEKEGDQPGANFGNASETLLLDYTSLTLPMAIYISFTKGHWKVFRTKVLGRLQHLFPIIVAGSFTISDTDATLKISAPLFVVISMWLFICLIWIPLETLGCEDSRYLPRSLCSTADILSWSYTSSLLRGKLPPTTEYGFHNGDPLDIRFVLDGQDAPSQTGLSRQASMDNSDGVPGPTRQRFIQRTAYDRKHLEARLALTNTRFCFGLDRLNENNLYTVGICDSSTFYNKLSRPKRDSRLLQYLWPTTKKYKGSSLKRDDAMFTIEGWNRFQSEPWEADTSQVNHQPPAVIMPQEDVSESQN